MTTAEIDALTPEQLRVELAEQVMGLCYHDWRPKGNSPRPSKFVCLKCLKEAYGSDALLPPDYANDIAAAWTVVEKFNAEDDDGLFEAMTNEIPLVGFTAQEAATAICRAALKAVQEVTQ